MGYNQGNSDRYKSSGNGGDRRNDRERYQVKLENITSTKYVDEAEKVIQSLQGRDLLSTNKIRSILALVSDLNDKLRMDDSLSGETIKEDCGYIRMRFAYECGREQKVKTFVNSANLINFLKSVDDQRLSEKEVKEKALLFCKYMEALVAYHKYYGGNDK